MENRIRVKEAVTKARDQGNTMSKTAIAQKIYPNTDPHTAIVCLNNLESARTVNIDRVKVAAICKVLDTTADQLFGIKPKTK